MKKIKHKSFGIEFAYPPWDKRNTQFLHGPFLEGHTKIIDNGDITNE